MYAGGSISPAMGGAGGADGALVTEFLDGNPVFLETYLMKKWTLDRLEQFLRKSLAPALPEARLSLRSGTPNPNTRLERSGKQDNYRYFDTVLK